MRKRCRKSGRAYARLEGWGGGNLLMLRDASQRSGGCRSSRPRARKSGLPDLRLLKRPISGLPEIGCDAPQHEGTGARRILASQAAARARRPTCGCGKRLPAWFPCFRPVLYRERRNFNVSSRRRAGPPISRIQGVALYI